MKKLFSIVLALTLLLCLVSCGEKEHSPKTDGAKSQDSQLLETDESGTGKDDGNIPEPVSSNDEDDGLSLEEQRELALKVDNAVWSRVLSADNKYNELIDDMESTNSLLTLDDFCGELYDLMNTYSSDIGGISDKKAQDYIKYSQYYFLQIGDIAKNVKYYIEEMDDKYMEKGKNGMEALNAFIQATIECRFSYLSERGFSNEEIIEMGESFSE